MNKWIFAIYVIALPACGGAEASEPITGKLEALSVSKVAAPTAATAVVRGKPVGGQSAAGGGSASSSEDCCDGEGPDADPPDDVDHDGPDPDPGDDPGDPPPEGDPPPGGTPPEGDPPPEEDPLFEIWDCWSNQNCPEHGPDTGGDTGDTGDDTGDTGGGGDSTPRDTGSGTPPYMP